MGWDGHMGAALATEQMFLSQEGRTCDPWQLSNGHVRQHGYWEDDEEQGA